MGGGSGNLSFFLCSSQVVPLLHYTYQVENENHCDFTKLREMLIRTNMEDLCDSTHSRHYELYRKERLKQMGFEEGDKEGKVRSFPNQLLKCMSYISMPGKQLCGDVHNAERVSLAVSPREGGGDAAEVCPQVIYIRPNNFLWSW